MFACNKVHIPRKILLLLGMRSNLVPDIVLVILGLVQRS